jgi:hypothetical protein
MKKYADQFSSAFLAAESFDCSAAENIMMVNFTPAATSQLLCSAI